MDYDGNSINSARTMGPDGVAPRRSVVEPSIGSAITTGGRTTPQGGRLRPGDVLLGRYTVLAPLGEGGMGVVYKCLDTIGRIEVALKCLPPELSRNESEMEGIRENYAIVARLHHSAISGLRQLEKDPDFGEYYLVMDLAKGEDLSTILRRRHGVPMPLDEALAILRPLASALDYAHGEHVLHRDVKPANVKVVTLPAAGGGTLNAASRRVENGEDVESFGSASRPSESTLVTRHSSPVTSNLRVQLLDFGLAAEVRSSMSRVSLRGHVGSSGTPAYMAPEQWEAKRQSAATDQYSLAVMAYQMLSGYLPFEADDMEVLKSAVLTRAPDEIEDVPAHVNAALQKALAKNPKERFASCSEFVESIFKPQRTQSSQRDSFTEAQRHGESGRASGNPQPSLSEAEILRRRILLDRSVKAIDGKDRADNEFRPFVEEAELEMSVAEDACKFGRFGAAGDSLAKAQKALDALAVAKTERRAREEAERRAREEAERRAREEAERRAREEAERRAREQPEYKKEFKSNDSSRGRGGLVAASLFLAAIIGVAVWKAAESTPAAPSGPVTKTSSDSVTSHQAGERKVVRVGSQEVALRWCPPGSFTMGAPITEEGRDDDETQHRVTLTKGFWMGETEVTQGLWKEVMGDNPSSNKSGDNYPVEQVLWNDCQKFLKKLNARSPQSGLKWALPTEAQWEYACRAGTTGAYAGTGRLDDMGWYSSNSGNATHPVKGKQPNAWGLYDMHGNVYEWCQDWYGDYPSGAVTDPPGKASGARVLRGGCFWDYPQGCRSATRSWSAPGYRSGICGFRLLAFQDGK